MESRLQKFAVVIEQGSFTKAAQALHISQPALTNAIQKLERELKTELLVRDSHPLRPTPAGELALNTAQTFIINRSNLYQELDALAQRKPHFAIGMIDSIIDLVFTYGDGLRQLNTNADISLSVNNSHYLLNELEQFRLDACFIVEQEYLPPNITVTSIGSEPLLLVCHPEQTALLADSLQLGKLPSFLSYNRGSTTERLIRTNLLRHGITTEANFYSTSPSSMLKLVLDKRGAAVLPFHMVAPLLAKDELATPLPSVNIERRISFVKYADKFIPQTVVVELTQQVQAILMQLVRDRLYATVG